MTNRSQRWSQAKRHNQGVQLTLEVYVPIPKKHCLHPTEARTQIVEQLNQVIENVQEKVEALNGMVAIRQGV